MSKVVADDLENNQFSSLVQFLTATSSDLLVLHGKVISITGITRKKVKFLLRKFLHVNHLSKYGVVDTSASFEIVRIEPEAKSEKRAEKHEPLKRPTNWVPIHPPPTAVEPSLVIEWRGQPPTKKTRYKK